MVPRENKNYAYAKMGRGGGGGGKETKSKYYGIFRSGLILASGFHLR